MYRTEHWQRRGIYYRATRETITNLVNWSTLLQRNKKSTYNYRKLRELCLPLMFLFGCRIIIWNSISSARVLRVVLVMERRRRMGWEVRRKRKGEK